MSDPDPSAPLVWPVSTRTGTTNQRGLSGGLEEIFSLMPPGFAVQANGPVRAPRQLAGTIAKTGRPTLAVIGAFSATTWPTPARIDAADEEEGRAALMQLSDTLPFLGSLRCPRLVVPIGCGDLPGADAIRSLLEDAEDPRRLIREYWQERVAPREEAVDRVIRRLDLLARTASSVRFLLTPGSDPLTLLGAETAQWILEDVPVSNLGLALDTGAAGREGALLGSGTDEWLEKLGDRTELVLLSDHDGRRRSDLLPGTGLMGFSDLTDSLPRGVPWILHGDPGVPGCFFRESSRFLVDRMGPPPDTDNRPRAI